MSATKETLHDAIEAGMREAPVNFYNYIVKAVYNTNTHQSGWRIVGLWGDEEKGEGNRIGPTFPENELDKCEQLVGELETTYGLPVAIDTIIKHFEINHPHPPPSPAHTIIHKFI